MKIRNVLILCILPLLCFTQIESKKQYSFAGEGLLNDDLIDFNHDGHLDYFIQDYKGTYYHRAIGTAQFAEVIVLDGIFERYLYEIKDLDSDGDLDVIGFEKVSNAFVINYNDGNHHFHSKRFKINHTSLLSHFTSIDLDFDGISEIIATYHNENIVYSYKIDSESLIKSSFRALTKPFRIVSLKDKYGPQICIQYDVTKYTRFTTDVSGNIMVKGGGTEKSGLHVYQMLDINQDSIADVLLSTNYNAFLRLGNTNGTFAADKSLGEVSLSTGFDVFDVDMDQDLDIIFPRATEYSYSLFRNSGNGNFVSEQIDIDNKTKNIQFIASNLGMIDGRLYRNPLTNAPIGQTQIYESNAYFYYAAPFDVDGDGDMDLLANSQITNAYTLFENRNGVYIKNKRIDRPFANTSTTFIDINNDGKKDIVYLANNGLNWLQNLGGTNFSAAKSLGQISSSETLTSIFPGDFNGDGQTDLGLVNEKDQIFWLAKSGNTFNLNKNIILNYTGATDRAAGNYVIDFDNDGDMDVITGDGYGGIDLMENNHGSFTGSLKKLLPGFGTYGLRFADVNNDGYTDIIRLYHNGSGSSFIMICLNAKNNTLSSNSNIATVKFSNSLSLADINGDGLMDISVLEDDNNRLLWLFNRGDGTFTDPFVADDKVALASTGDVFGDYHEYFLPGQNDELNLIMAVDAILYISRPDSFLERYFLSVSNEKCDRNNTTLKLDDDFKSFELLALDFDDPAGNYDIYTQDTSWMDSGVYGKNKKYNLPKGSAGNGDKSILVKNKKDGYTQSFILKDGVSCFDTTHLSDLDGLMIFHHEMNGISWQDNTLFAGRKWKEMYIKYTSNQNILPSEYCTLPGVKCVNNQVVEVKLEARNLSGQLSDAISYCRNLETLDLSSNAITLMPPSMKRFTSLKNLDLFGNDLTGEIPFDIGDCSNLVVFDVGANELSGIIPVSITKLTKLERFILGGGGTQINKITGEIPEEIGNMTSLKEINFTSQPLSGNLPESMGDLKKLEKVNIFLTKIGGKLPESLAGIFNPKLTTLNLNSNSFTGCIPAGYKVFCSLSSFSIRYSSASKIDSKEFCETNKHNCSNDNDMDGFIFPVDCDDSNVAVHPGAEELDFNDVDENCDGMLETPCQTYQNNSHNTFDSALNTCRKLYAEITLFPDGNRSPDTMFCFGDISQYSAFWQKFKIFKEGTFYFGIAPKDSLSDIDFALFRMTDPKDKNSLELVRCNRSVCKGTMGLSDLETDIMEDEHCGGLNNNFLANLDVKKGEYYALLIIEKNNRKTKADLAMCGSALLGAADNKCTDLYFIKDQDQDGHNSYIDCNDDNPDIHPLAPEILFNDVDENCDGKALLPCIDRTKTTNIFSSFEKTPLICSKAPLTYPANEWGKDMISIACGGSNYLMRSYVTVQKIKILKGGSFYFKIKPNVTNQSVTFGVYKTSNNFDKSTLSMVRCCLSGLHTGPIPTEIGLSPFENDEQEGAYGVDLSKGKNGFVKAIEAKDGDEYTIYTNSFQPNVVLTTTYCGTASFVYDDVECETISSTELISEHHITLHQNIVSFDLSYDSDVHIEDIRIININGIVLSTKHQDQTIDVSQLPSGVYFCQFKTASQLIYRKFVKI